MKISQLIKQLDQAAEEIGDVEVVTYSIEWLSGGGWYPVNNIEKLALDENGQNQHLQLSYNAVGLD